MVGFAKGSDAPFRQHYHQPGKGSRLVYQISAPQRPSALDLLMLCTKWSSIGQHAAGSLSETLPDPKSVQTRGENNRFA